MFNTYGRTPFAFMTFGRWTILDRLLDPRCRVLHRQSPIPYAVLRVISCLERVRLLDGLLPLLLAVRQRFRVL
jgi:hypothetical protein